MARVFCTMMQKVACSSDYAPCGARTKLKRASEGIVQPLRTLVALVFTLVTLFWPSHASAEVTAYLFWQEGCPYCERAKASLQTINEDNPDLRLIQIELGISEQNNSLFITTVEKLELERTAVPMLVVGSEAIIGFSTALGTENEYRQAISQCQDAPCVDIVGMGGAAENAPTTFDMSEPDRKISGKTITLPFLGEIELESMSLPALTVVLAAVDGFNPCAMWVLLLLIGLLLGVEDRRRVWTLGIVFFAATGVMYFAVMAAWLNVVLWIGAASWLRLVIGAASIAAGIYYLREYWTNPEGICRITPSSRRKSIADRFRSLVEQPSLLAASLGIAALAIGVNLVELACSVGVPAIFTQTLAMHDLPATSYYGYLVLYLAVFLLDDASIFVAAMIMLRSVTFTSRFSRMSHLIGGIVLLGLGAIMLLRPDLLS